MVVRLKRRDGVRRLPLRVRELPIREAGRQDRRDALNGVDDRVDVVDLPKIRRPRRAGARGPAVAVYAGARVEREDRRAANDRDRSLHCQAERIREHRSARARARALPIGADEPAIVDEVFRLANVAPSVIGRVPLRVADEHLHAGGGRGRVELLRLRLAARRREREEVPDQRIDLARHRLERRERIAAVAVFVLHLDDQHLVLAAVDDHAADVARQAPEIVAGALAAERDPAPESERPREIEIARDRAQVIGERRRVDLERRIPCDLIERPLVVEPLPRRPFEVRAVAIGFVPRALKRPHERQSERVPLAAVVVNRAAVRGGNAGARAAAAAAADLVMGSHEITSTASGNPKNLCPGPSGWFSSVVCSTCASIAPFSFPS